MSARRLAFLGTLLVGAGGAHATATIQIFNGDAPGTGFNDPTPASPVGGNDGTTRGAQRLKVFHEAARIWGEALDSTVTISVFARFTQLTCDSTGAVLGSAAPTGFLASDPPLANGLPAPVDGGVPNTIFPRQSTWYPAALVERLAGQELSSNTGSDPGNYDIQANFNSTLDDTNATNCGGLRWYYGLDNQHGEKVDLLTVVLHEFGHGLGFTTITDRVTGEFAAGQDGGVLPDVWAYYLYDEAAGKHWTELTAAQRASSSVGQGLAWDGPAVKAAVPTTPFIAPLVRVTAAPNPAVVKDYAGTVAQFSAPIGSTPVEGALGVGSTGWGCTALGRLEPLDNKIAILDRGGPTPDAGCTFVEKARNAQDAGAVGLLIANNTTGLGSPGGTAPDVTIPVMMITQQDGQTLKAAVDAGTVLAQILLDSRVGLVLGVDNSNRVLMYAPPALESGSSVSHFDTSVFPDVLMEPNINADLTHSLDLTLPLMRDIGWFDVDVAIAGNGPTTLGSGQEGTFTFTVTNPGPSVAPAVSVANALDGLTFVSNAGDCTTSFPCALGDLAAGASRSITTRLKASSGNQATTTATVSSASNFNPTNDAAKLTVNAGVGTGGSGQKSGCTSSGGPPAPWLALLSVLALARRRRRA